MHGIPSNGVATSDAAAASIVKDVARLKAIVLDAIKREGGLTCDEVEIVTGLRHQTASARVYDLKKVGRIVDSGTRKKTRSGRDAIVWVVAEVAPSISVPPPVVANVRGVLEFVPPAVDNAMAVPA